MKEKGPKKTNAEKCKKYRDKLKKEKELKTLPQEKKPRGRKPLPKTIAQREREEAEVLKRYWKKTLGVPDPNDLHPNCVSKEHVNWMVGVIES